MSILDTIHAFFEALNQENVRFIELSDDPVCLGYGKGKLVIQAFPKKISKKRYKIELFEYKKRMFWKTPKLLEKSEIIVSIDNEKQQTCTSEKDSIRKAISHIKSEDLFQIYESHEPLTLTLASLDGSTKQVEAAFQKDNGKIIFEIYIDN